MDGNAAKAFHYCTQLCYTDLFTDSKIKETQTALVECYKSYDNSLLNAEKKASIDSF